MPQNTDNNSKENVVATILKPDGDEQVYVYDANATSNEIITGSTGSAGINLKKYYVEEITETVERSKGLLNGGIKLSFKLPSDLGGFEIGLERKPRKETKTIKKAIYMPKKDD